MKALLQNPLDRAARFGPARGLWIAGMAWAILLLLPLGVCPDTVFAASTGFMVLAVAFGVGNSAFGALTGEREKKTLDSLRLTQLSAHEVLLGKLMPELRTLGRLLAFTAPPVLVAGATGIAGVAAPFEAVGIAALGGVFAAVAAVFVSSWCATTSQAVVAGWILKVVWLMATPLLDMVVGAVFVQSVSPPVFSALNPLAALGVILVPEAAEGARAWIPALYPGVTALGIGLMWMVAAGRFASGMVSKGGLKAEKMHPVYSKGWGPAVFARWIPMLRENPAFLRELAAQVRSGAGRWPGYMVFLVLFLAPTFYARSWTLNEAGRVPLDQIHRNVQVASVTDQDARAIESQTGTIGKPAVFMRTSGGVGVMLKGHTDEACLRMFLFESFGVPLPQNDLCYYSISRPYLGGEEATVTPMAQPDADTARSLGLKSSDALGEVALTEENRDAINQSSLHVGIAGAIALFLLYLAIRYSAFLATAVTGERSRRTWEDLALSGLSPADFMKGKLAGSVILPWMQMTLAFPALLLFVLAGDLGISEIAGLYLYAVALTVAAGMLGLWASTHTATSHDAHLRALGLVLFVFFVLPLLLPVLSPLLVAAALIACLTAAVHGRTSAVWWAAVSFALGLAPQAASPLTAAVSFMPSLTTSSSFLTLLGVAPSTDLQAVLNLACGVVLLGSLSAILWRASMARLMHVSESESLQAEEPIACMAVI